MSSLLPISTSDVTQEVMVRKDSTDPSGRANAESTTIMENFDQAVQKFGSIPALHAKIDGNWTSWTWKEYRNQVDKFGMSLLSIGFQKFDSVNIIGFNSPQWFFANFGAIAAGGIPAGICKFCIRCILIRERERERES